MRSHYRFAADNTNNTRNAVNRGASGIDGILATAAGWTLAGKTPGVAVLGDLASWHDLGTFLQLADSDIPLLVCILNNGGGGIFSFLPISKQEDIFEDLFATAHKKSFLPILSGMNIRCHQIHSTKRLQEELDTFFAKPQFSVLELFGDRKENYILHQEIEEKLQTVINQQLEQT